MPSFRRQLKDLGQAFLVGIALFIVAGIILVLIAHEYILLSVIFFIFATATAIYFNTKPKFHYLKNGLIHHKYFSITIPKDWKIDYDEFTEYCFLYAEKESNSIINITFDNNNEEILKFSNKKISKKYSPLWVLQKRLESINESTLKDKNSPWKKFKINYIKSRNINNKIIAESVFSVDETVFIKKKEVWPRKIIRSVFFAKNDVVNIVFSSTKIENFDEEKKEYEKIVQSIKWQ